MKAIHTLLFITACCISIQTFATEKLSVSELLDRLTVSQDKLRSLIAKTEETIVSNESNSPTTYITRRISEVKIDGNKSHQYWYRWRHLPAEDAPTPIEDAHCFFKLWDGNCYIEYYKPMKAPDVRSAYVTRDEKHIQDNVRIGYPHSPFLGIRYSDYERIDSVLRQADSISVRDELEKVDSVACYVIDAKAKSGDYTVWLDPEHGYNVAKINIQLGPNNLYNGKRLDSNESDSLSVQNIRFERIDGAWIPMEADLYLVRKRQDSFVKKSAIHHKITQIILDPDHEALGSFVPKIENGTKVRNLDSGESYIWQAGKKFVTDEWDGSIKYVPEDWSILVGVSKPLPEFEGINLDIAAEDIRDKTILLSFFNMNQRPSRNCLLQLNRRAKELKAKDMAVVAIQASTVDYDKLNNWVKKNNIPSPVGMIQGDTEKTRFTWGVRSLPWLILTDKEHIVQAEGFRIEELDEKLKKIELTPAKQANRIKNPKPSKSFLNAEEILAAWESSYGSIRTMKFSYVYRLVEFQPSQMTEDNPEEPLPNPTKIKHVERIEEGKRYHLRYSLAEDGFNNPEWLVEYAFDGKITQSYMGSTKSGVISLGQMGGSEETDEGLKRFMFLTNHKTPDVLKDEYPNGIPELALWFKLGKLRGRVVVRPHLEYVADQTCHVVEIIDDSKVGGEPRELKLVYWIAHDKGMCPMKFQTLENGELENEIEIEKIAVTEMDNNRIWYPQKAHSAVYIEEIGMIRNELTVTDFVPNIEVNEDTFRLDFIEGTRVTDIKSMISYKWQKGMKFIVDDRDGNIRYVPEDWSILVGVGKPLPEFEGIDLEIAAEDIRDKAILLCFFHMNQRPSRNCLLQLSKKAKELKIKGVFVVAVHASKADKAKLNDWIKKNNISFPIGMVQDDEEKIRFTWGVRSLPWLILTDKEHIVTAEGFSVTELDDKLNGNSN